MISLELTAPHGNVDRPILPGMVMAVIVLLWILLNEFVGGGREKLLKVAEELNLGISFNSDV